MYLSDWRSITVRDSDWQSHLKRGNFSSSSVHPTLKVSIEK